MNNKVYRSEKIISLRTISKAAKSCCYSLRKDLIGISLYIGTVKGGQFYGQQITKLNQKSFSKDSDAVGYSPKRPLELDEYENQVIAIEVGSSHAASVIDVLDEKWKASFNELYENRNNEHPALPIL